MIKIPKDLKKKMYDYETFYHLSMTNDRLGKFLAHYEAFKLISEIPGEIVECGVFKGTSFVRFALFRELLGGEKFLKIVSF